MNKKGNVAEVTGIIIALFSLAIVSLVTVMIFDYANTAFQGDADVPSTTKAALAQANTDFPKVLDFWFALFFIGLPLISAALAYFNNVHPVFFWLSLLLVFLTVLYGAGLSEAWKALGEDTELATYQARMPVQDYILDNYGLYSFFVFVLVASGTFIKLRRGNVDAVGGI